MKKKVFMFANYTPSDESIGITKKITSEIRTLRSFGYEVFYTAYEKNSVVICDNNDSVVFEQKFLFRNKKLNKAVRYFLLEAVAKKYLEKNNSFTLGYIRLGPPNFTFFKILDLLKKGGAKIIVESLAYFPGVKYNSVKGRYIQFMHKINYKRFKKYLEYFLIEGNFKEMYGIPCYSMNMGVEVEKIKPHKYFGNKDELNLISVANENIYHAYDRIIKSVYNYINNGGRKKVYIHFVGTISEKTRALIKQLNLEKFIILYGKKSGSDLDNIYNFCNVGLGPFGQHRIGGKKDTGLKTKEYFAKGLPYIFSGEEPTVPKGYPYICAFPSDESMIDFEEVWNFYQTYVDDKNVVKNMRDFAIKNYSWDRIMREALSKLK